MSLRHPFPLLAGLAVVCLGLSACGSDEPTDTAGSPAGEVTGEAGSDLTGSVTVFAAASLTDVFTALGEDFMAANPDVEVTFNFAGSSTLAEQINQGAPADVFASASEEEMDTATKDGLVYGGPEVFVENREVVMVPKDNPAGIENFRDVAKPDVKLVLAEEGVPAADYALEILGKADEEYGAGFEKDVLSNVVSREADVRASVNRVVVGDADATFGYASDFTPDIRDRVDIVPIPPDLNIIATYPVAALKDAKDPELARKWVNLVTGEEGQRVLDKWGFEPAA